MFDYECYICEYTQHDEKKPMWCPSCGSIDSFKLMETDAQKLSKSEEEITRLRQLISDLKEDAVALAEDYCPSWEQNHAKTCSQSLLGKHYGREKEPCDCGYEAKYQKHAALMEKIEKAWV